MIDPVRTDAPLSDAEALQLADVSLDDLPILMASASRVRDDAWGKTATFSPKVFLPLTNVCRNRCDYCSFRKSPADDGAWTMSHAEVDRFVTQAAAQGCAEALFCLGDKPETAYAAYRATLATIGHDSTVDYLVWAAQRALKQGLLPHTNAGILSRTDMERLRPFNVSLGLMLENISPRLCEKGMPHHKAPDKRPQVRVQMIRQAGELKIPFTTGILIGIGETRRERVESLLAIRALHRAHGHIQEVIVQNFVTRPGIAMAESPEPDDLEIAHAVALARLILDRDVSLQAPPNLNPHRTALLLRAGINDFGGISPVTPDFINPKHPWPMLHALESACQKEGFTLRPRMPIYDAYVERPEFLDPALLDITRRTQTRLHNVRGVDDLAASSTTTSMGSLPVIAGSP